MLNPRLYPSPGALHISLHHYLSTALSLLQTVHCSVTTIALNCCKIINATLGNSHKAPTYLIFVIFWAELLLHQLQNFFT